MRQEWTNNQSNDVAIGAARQSGVTGTGNFAVSIGEVRNDAFDILSRFQTVLEASKSATTVDYRQHIDTLQEIGRELPLLIARLEPISEAEDASLLSALRDVLNEVGPLREEFKRKSGRLYSSTATSPVDLNALRSDLAERAARRELGETIVSSSSTGLEIPIHKNSAGGIPMLIFGVGWLSFTMFHCCMMIGGLFHAVGPMALFLLGFYAIFFAVGFGMLWSGINAFRKETIVLSGKQLTIKYRLFGRDLEKNYSLDQRSRAYVTKAMVQSKGSRNQEIAILTMNGKEIRVGNGMADPLLYEEAGRINDYLASVFGTHPRF